MRLDERFRAEALLEQLEDSADRFADHIARVDVTDRNRLQLDHLVELVGEVNVAVTDLSQALAELG